MELCGESLKQWLKTRFKVKEESFDIFSEVSNSSRRGCSAERVRVSVPLVFRTVLRFTISRSRIS